MLFDTREKSQSGIEKSLVLSVTEISAMLKRVVEDFFSDVKVRGEISGYKKASSGHVYFFLKDTKSLISAVCWQNIASSIDISLEDGLEVICKGYISTYPGRSNYQLVVQQITVAGYGSLLALLEKRKEMLQKEGLFSTEHKKKLPYLPRSIGIITSLQGAVIKDIIHRIEERFPMNVMVWDVPVQGKEAPEKIIEALNGFDNLTENKPDLLIIARGGGSIEDLWCFNDEGVVRSIFKSSIPIISAIGHETDFTLADLVADLRAPTPTAAAELAIPVKKDLYRSLEVINARSNNAILNMIKSNYLKLSNFNSKLERFCISLDKLRDNLNNLQFILDNNIEKTLKLREHKLAVLQHKLFSKDVNLSLDNQLQRLELLKSRIDAGINDIFISKNMRLQILMTTLRLYDKRGILNRGFAIARDKKGHILSSTTQLHTEKNIGIEVADGVCTAVINNNN